MQWTDLALSAFNPLNEKFKSALQLSAPNQESLTMYKQSLSNLDVDMVKYHGKICCIVASCQTKAVDFSQNVTVKLFEPI